MPQPSIGLFSAKHVDDLHAFLRGMLDGEGGGKMHNPTILTVAYPFAPLGADAVGGAEQVATALDAALSARSWRSIVVAHAASRAAGVLVGTEVPEGVITPEIREAVERSHQANIDFALASFSVDLIHMHDFLFHRYRIPPHLPVLVTLHLPPSWYPKSIWELPANFHIQWVSQTQRNMCPAKVRHRIAVVQNGVPIPPAEISRKAGFVAMLSRICPEKNLHVGLDAASMAGVPALLAGRVFPYKEHLRYFDEEIRPRLRPGRARPLGGIGAAGKLRLLSRASGLLLPSMAPETSSLVAMEAAAAGTPVIAFPSGAVSEIVAEGCTCFLVRSTQEMAEAIGRSPEIDPEACRAQARAFRSCERLIATSGSTMRLRRPGGSPFFHTPVETSRRSPEGEGGLNSLHPGLNLTHRSGQPPSGGSTSQVDGIAVTGVPCAFAPGMLSAWAMLNSLETGRHGTGRIDRLEVETYKVPTELPESDGTLQWDHTDISIVTVYAQGKQGMGYTFAGLSAAALIHGVLAKVVKGMDPMSPQAAYMAMWRRTRNMGRPGICSMAISAVDCALWDLKARLLDRPLASLLGRVRDAAAVYGSGGFTSYTDHQLSRQLEGWAREEIGAVKMKIGRDPARDIERLRTARKAIGPDVRLYADANGAYTPREALAQAEMLAEHDVRWFEEPVSSDNLGGMRFVREHVGPRMNIAAGEYGYDLFYFGEMLNAGAVDILQADITRCGGITCFMQVAALCQARNVSLSAHTAPAQHAHAACAAIPLTEIEYFHDHVRIEQIFFEGLPKLVRGELRPDLSRPGNGLEVRRKDAEKYAA